MESPILSYLAQVHDELTDLRAGHPSMSIPALAAGNPDSYGVALATVDGRVYEVGDSREEFSIQSLSKPFTYGLALQDQGFDALDAKVDVEPSGDAFNEISLAPDTGRPSNPMINAGALTATAQVDSRGSSSRFDRILANYSGYAGRELSVNTEIAAQEGASGHRNRALAHLLRSFTILESDPDPVVEDYFRQCSIMVTCRDLSLMAATLANGGVNPVTGDEVLGVAGVERVLTVMTTCGMYDDAGEWMIRVGMPGKSGIGGGIIAVLPGQVGLAVYSPSLDQHGNSVRGVATCERLSTDMELHFVRAGRAARSVIRGRYDIADAPSGVRRNEEAIAALEQHSQRATVLELQGDLRFAEVETVIREIVELSPEVEYVVLDVRRVDEVVGFSVGLFAEVRQRLRAEGRWLVMVDTEGKLQASSADVATDPEEDLRVFETLSAAVEWCENELIRHYGDPAGLPRRAAVEDSTLLSRLSDEDAAALRRLMDKREYDDGDVILRVGQRFAGIHVILSGTVSTYTRSHEDEQVRLTTLSAGMTFGELALGSDGRQETTVRAEGPVTVRLLSRTTIERLEAEDPRLAMILWKAMTRDAYLRVDQQLREIAVRAAERT